MVRVLVTGAAGFIGSHIVDELVAQGSEVVALDGLLPAAHSETPAYLNRGAEWIFADIRDSELLEHSLAGVDTICHQAAMVGLGVDFSDVTSYVSHNDLGTAALLQAMHGRRFTGHMVLASSMVVYGEGAYSCPQHGDVRPGPRKNEDLTAGRFEPVCPRCGSDLRSKKVTEDAELDPRNVYAATKVHQEHLCSAYARESGASLTALRYHNVYGPRMPADTPYAGVAAIFRSALERGQAPRVFEDGRQMRNFVHVSDVAHANVLALEASVPGAFNIASLEPRSVGEMAAALSSGLGGLPAVTTGEYRLGDVRHVFASPERARRELGFEAAISFVDGMREFARAPLRGGSPQRAAITPKTSNATATR